MNLVFPITIPLLNANDDTVQVVNWLVEHGTHVDVGEAICEIETSKATTTLEAEHDGVNYQISAAQSMAKVGQQIGLIGPDLKTIENYLSNNAATRDGSKLLDRPQPPLQATSRAQILAAQHGISLQKVADAGVHGTIKETDVQRYFSALKQTPELPRKTWDQTELPPAIREYVMHKGDLSRHEQFVAQNLERTLQNVLLATIDAVLDLTSVKQCLLLTQRDGEMLSLLHIIMCALGCTLPHYPQLISFRHNGQVYRYHQLDLAFVVRIQGGRLYTPVVRGVDKLDLAQTAQACNKMAMRVNRGRIKPKDLEGSCFTVSHVPSPITNRLNALPNRFQSAVLAIAGERSILSLKNGQVSQIPVVTLTLSYDHALCDAVYAAEFLQHLLEQIDMVTA